MPCPYISITQPILERLVYLKPADRCTLNANAGTIMKKILAAGKNVMKELETALEQNDGT